MIENKKSRKVVIKNNLPGSSKKSVKPDNEKNRGLSDSLITKIQEMGGKMKSERKRDALKVHIEEK